MPWLILSLSLTCSNLVLPLDDSLRAPEGFGDFMTRDSSLYMLQGLTTTRDDGDAFTVPCAGVAPELLEALAGTLAFDGTLDPRALREVFEDRYHHSLDARGQATWIPPTLGQFEAKTGYRTWPDLVVEFSAVKRKSRRVFRSPDGFQPRISVSQTLESETGDRAAPVRETEVGIERGPEGNWDFYVYGPGGELRETSTFPAGERPSPKICIACHYDAGRRKISRFFPDVF